MTESSSVLEIRTIGPEELLVRFPANPSAVDCDEWLARFGAVLEGAEKTARIDLKGLTGITSLCVNVTVGIYQRMSKQGGTIRVEVPTEKARRVFELFQLTSLFEVAVVQP